MIKQQLLHTKGMETAMPEEFRRIELSDKEWMQSLFDMSGYQSEEYNFNFCYMWQDALGYKVTRAGDYLLLKTDLKRPSYMFPPGSGDIASAIEVLMRDAEKNGHGFAFFVVLGEQKKLLETMYPNRFEYTALTDYYDYIYDAESLITLSGKKLHSKRNHINRFKEQNPDWTYEEITPENLPEVVIMSEEWCRINECLSTATGREEACSVRRALSEYFALKLSGGLIRAGGRIVAFSVGERLNADTYLVHIEKAFSDVQGAYAVINQEFAAHNCTGYLYIDREDDSGQPGLRKAKLSYRPVYQVEKYAAKLKA